MLLLGEEVGCLQTAILGIVASLCFLGRWGSKHNLVIYDKHQMYQLLGYMCQILVDSCIPFYNSADADIGAAL